MATIKIKFRASSVSGKEGTLFLQVIHRRVARQLSTWYKVFPEEWDAARQTVAFPEDVSPYRSRYLREVQEVLDSDRARTGGLVPRCLPFQPLYLRHVADRHSELEEK